MKKQASLILCVSALILQTATLTHADLGPKPTIHFNVKGITQQPTDTGLRITEGTLMLCEAADCSDAAPLQQVGPQHFGCSANACSGMAYGFSPYMRLDLTLSDGSTRKSNVFEKKAFDAQFNTIVTTKELRVSEQ